MLLPQNKISDSTPSKFQLKQPYNQKAKHIRQFKFPLLIIIFFIQLHICLYAQRQDIKFDCLSLEDGLSQTTVLSILQDSTGYMWFGTVDGLNKFDGYSFTVYTSDPADSTSLSDDWITSMYLDRKGVLWIGTLREGLNKYNSDDGTFTHYKINCDPIDLPLFKKTLTELPTIFNFFNSNSITSIYEDRCETLWIGTFGNGLFKFNREKGQLKRFAFDDTNSYGLKHNIMSICETVAGDQSTLWIGTFGGGLIKYKEDHGFKIYSQNRSDPNSLGNNRIIGVYPDTDCDRSSLWIGTHGSGLDRFDIDEEKFVHYRNNSNNPNSLSDNSVLVILKDSCDVLWTGTLKGGLNKFDPQSEKFICYRHDPFNPNSLGSNKILSLFEDRSGIIWVGTNLGHGVNKFDKEQKKFTHYFHDPTNPNSLSDNVIFAMHEDPADMLWIGTFRGGLNKFDRNKNEFTRYRSDPSDPASLSDDHIRSIFVDSRGTLWIGTFAGGLNRFDRARNKFKHYKHIPADPSSLSDNHVRAIYEDQFGTLWIGTFGGGLDKFNRKTGKFSHYKHDPSDPNSLSDDRIYQIIEDQSGSLWLATFDGGLCRFDRETEKFNSYQNDPFNSNSLSDNRIFSICQDPTNHGVLWLGTSGGGLNKFDRENGKFTHYTQNDGLPNNVVYGILTDEEGNFWLSTNRGLSKFCPGTETFTNYDVSDGLQSNEFNAGAYFKSQGGEMFFGGINGFNSFYPQKVRTNTNIPRIVLTSFKIFDNEMTYLIGPISEAGKIELSHEDNFFSFEFSALDYTKLGKNQFAYKLEGLNKDWIRCGTRRYVNYTNLDPGNYTFRVKGSNSDGVWNEEGTFVKLKIHPRFYQRKWFHPSVILFLVIMAVLFFRYRLHRDIKRSIEMEHIRMAENERVRKTLAADFHDELGQKLTRIALFSEILKRKLAKTVWNNIEYIDKIITVAKDLSGSTRDFIWTLDPDQDSLHDAMIYLKDFGDEIFDKTSINFRVNGISQELRKIRLPVEWRRHLTLIFKEGMTNVLKHAECKNAAFNIELNHTNMIITLSDDGIGYDIEQKSLGRGIHNMNSRAETIHAEIDIISNNGNGTTIRFVSEIPQMGH